MNKDIRCEITQLIADFAEREDANGRILHIWRTPIVRFGDAKLPAFRTLPELAHPGHLLPEDILEGAETVIAYFFPFRETLGSSNLAGRLSSAEWALAYEKTNAAFGRLNEQLIAFLAERGIRAAAAPKSAQYDSELLMARWSQKSVGYLCGLGSFGLHRMLITDEGCCGRIGTVVTDLDVPHDMPVEEEYCLYKKQGSCGVCADRCPSGALTREGYDRSLCGRICAENEQAHRHGSVPVNGADICGKCAVGLPCTFRRP